MLIGSAVTTRMVLKRSLQVAVALWATCHHPPVNGRKASGFDRQYS
jgi:hypothetical protein